MSKKLILVTSRVKRPSGRGDVLASLMSRLTSLDIQQLQIVTLVVAAIQRGAR